MIPVSVREYLPDVEVDPLLVSGVLCGSAVVILALKWMQRSQTVLKIEQAHKRREEGLRQMENVLLKFQQQNGKLNMDAVTTLSMAELAAKLQDGSITPERALYTYIAKALEVHKQTNCLAGFLPECEAQLREVKKQKEKGLLYGLPVSIKEHYGIKGHDNNIGLACFINIPAQKDSVIVQVLKKQGAIPFVKTSESQSMFNFDCSNPINGQTLNPLNLQKTTGGSTGGEGALIAGGGSLLGFGSDIGGSIRIPCSFCGLCGLKPTGRRFSLLGIAAPMYGELSVESMIGPMARDVDSLVLCLRALLCEEMFRLDPMVPPIPFNEEVYSSSAPLRIGYFDTDGYCLPVPCMRRAVQETKRLLEDAGHEFIPFTPPRIEHVANELFTKGIFSDGGSSLMDAFEGDIIDPNLKPLVSINRLPRWVKKVLSVILRPLSPRVARELSCLAGVGESESAGKRPALCNQHLTVFLLKDKVCERALGTTCVNAEFQMTIKELTKLTKPSVNYREEFINEWKSHEIDVILCPAYGPAMNFGYLGKLWNAISTTHLFNVLNFPAGVVPVTTVTKADEDALKNYKGHYNDHWDKLLQKAATGGLGLPVAVQCVALPWQEEMCLRLMKEVEQLTMEKKRRS